MQRAVFVLINQANIPSGVRRSNLRGIAAYEIVRIVGYLYVVLESPTLVGSCEMYPVSCLPQSSDCFKRRSVVIPRVVGVCAY